MHVSFFTYVCIFLLPEVLKLYNVKMKKSQLEVSEKLEKEDLEDNNEGERK